MTPEDQTTDATRAAMRALLLLCALSLAGCSDKADAIHKVLKQCRSKVGVTIQLNFWGNSAEFRCDDMPIDDAKDQK